MLNEFIDYLELQVLNHSIYVWAAQGEGYNVINDAWIRKMETSEVNAERAIKHWKAMCALGFEKVLRAFDCSGLGMAWIEKHIATPDLTAYGMYTNLCEPITKSKLKRGDWVFKKNSSGKISHIGYIVDDKLNVIEAQGRDYGVVKRPLSATTWTVFGRPKMFKAEIEKEEDTFIATRVLKRTKPTMKGEDVKKMQQRLIDRGFSCGSKGADGSFGDDTKAAVIKFQKYTWPKDEKEWDGIAGRKTLTALGAICKW